MVCAYIYTNVYVCAFMHASRVIVPSSLCAFYVRVCGLYVFQYACVHTSTYEHGCG